MEPPNSKPMTCFAEHEFDPKFDVDPGRSPDGSPRLDCRYYQPTNVENVLVQIRSSKKTKLFSSN